MSISAVPQECKVRLRLFKSDKLRFKAQFDQARRDGNKFAGSGVVVIVAPAPEGKTECGVICSKKYSLLSVVRNRARRLLWESFRELKPELQPCRILLIPRRKMMGYNQLQSVREVAYLLEKAGVLQSEKLLCRHES